MATAKRGSREIVPVKNRNLAQQRQSTQRTRGRLPGQRGLPARTRDVIDLGGGVTYEI